NLRFGTYSGTSNHRYGCLGTAVKLRTGYHGRFGVADGVYHGAHRNHGCTVRTGDGRTASTRHDAHRVVSKRSSVIYRQIRTNAARLIAHFVEPVTGFRAVKSYRRQRANGARYEQLAEDHRQASLRSVQLFGIYQPMLRWLSTITIA